MLRQREFRGRSCRAWAGDRGEPAHSRHHRSRAQREGHCDRVNPALIATAVGDLGEPSHQVRTHHRITAAAGKSCAAGGHDMAAPSAAKPDSAMTGCNSNGAPVVRSRGRTLYATGAPSPTPQRQTDGHQRGRSGLRIVTSDRPPDR